MRLIFWVLLSVAFGAAANAAEPTCSAYQQKVAPNSPQCFETATDLQDTDIVYGVQGTGPSRDNQSVKVSIAQLKAATQAALSVVNVAANHSSTATERYICVNHASPVTITLMPSPTAGALQTVTDCAGAAGTSTITVQPASGTVMGAADVQMTQPYMSLDFVYTGSGWVLQ